MTSPLPPKPNSRRVLRVLATVVAGALTLFLVNSFSGSTTDPQNVATASLFSVSGTDSGAVAPVPTTAPMVAQTAPLQLPTATPEPTPVPTATPVPPTPVPPTPEPQESEPVAAPTAAPEVSAAPAASPPLSADSAAPDLQSGALDAQAEAVAPDAAATATPIAAQPTPEPTPVTAADIEIAPTATAEPAVEPTLVPTATPEPLLSIADLENYVLSEINGVRARVGLGPVALDSSVSTISRDWSQQMASGGFFSHRPSNQLNTMLPSGWREWGENIASAPDIYWAQSSLENSPGHYANMVGSFTHVGIGVYQVDGQVWVTQNFVRY